jgi:mevalonate pyrophosphate decarboxylase
MNTSMQKPHEAKRAKYWNDSRSLSCFVISNNYPSRLEDIKDSLQKEIQYIENADIKRKAESAVKAMELALKHIDSFSGILEL